MSWDDLVAIHKENESNHFNWLSSPPESCPNDGTPLTRGPNGELFCDHDGWCWDGDPYSKGQA